MSQTIKISNFYNANIKEISKLDADSVVSANTLTVAYTDNMQPTDYLYVGTFGAESSEKVVIGSVASPTSLTIASPFMTKPHSRFDNIATLFGNQLRIYRAANTTGTQPADAAFSLLATVDIDFDQVTTSYTDASGSSAHWYKHTYYNSTSLTETPLADSPAVRGGGIGNYCSIESIRKRAGLEGNRFIADTLIDEYRQSAQDEVNSNLIGLYVVPFTTPISPLIKEITKKIAAGNLLLNDYGPTTILDTTNGSKMVEEGRALLARIKNKELVLPDALGNDSSIQTSGGLVMWPNTTTETADPSVGGGARMFRVSDRY